MGVGHFVPPPLSPEEPLKTLGGIGLNVNGVISDYKYSE